MVSYSAVYGQDMLECPSNPSVSSSTNLGGNNIRFTIEQPEDIVYNGKNCYLTVQLQIAMVREDGSTVKPLVPIINSGSVPLQQDFQFLIYAKIQLLHYLTQLNLL